ncbi:MAG: pyrroline-5-carboxylate reductase [Acidimicrobiia bacterium]|nr:pyrroline-5-carboxylate reductase [Acidimicrobiia bacterium]
MGEALLGGLIADGWAPPEELAVVETRAPRRRELAGRYPRTPVSEEPQPGVDAVLAVKPDDVESAAGVLSAAGSPRVLSIAAGVRTASLERWLGAGVRVVRAMPNTPALVGCGASAVAPGASASEHDVRWAVEVLASVGTVEVTSEAQLDAVTGLSGSGPAYVFLVAEALIAAGIAEGLPPEVADGLVRETIRGAGELLVRSDRAPAALRADVTSRGGTTERGISVLEQEGLREAFAAAVAAATRRSLELGRA